MIQRISIALVISFAAGSAATATSITEHMKAICAQSIHTDRDSVGESFEVLPVYHTQFGGKFASVLNQYAEGKATTLISVLDSSGTNSQFTIPQIDFNRVLLTEKSLWFLTDDELIEVDLNSKAVLGKYPSYPQKFEVKLATKARGFTYDRGFIYIAHGILGVVVFNANLKEHYMVRQNELQNGSLAASVLIQGTTMYLLQGAYHPNGFNGISISNLSNGGVKTVGYPPASGVVDPYSGMMVMTKDRIFINNSGWIHTYSLADLAQAKSTLAPAWIEISETVEAEGQYFSNYLTVKGDLALAENSVLACSSVRYNSKKYRRPVKEWRFLQQSLN